MEEQKGSERVVPFSFTNTPEELEREQVSCWLTYTNENTHNIIRNNINRSPLYSGDIEGTGPRYCPSIEDKVVRFADKKRHQVFLEPEGNYTNEMYVYTPMRCTLAVCPGPFRRMYRRPCTTVYRDLSMLRS